MMTHTHTAIEPQETTRRSQNQPHTAPPSTHQECNTQKCCFISLDSHQECLGIFWSYLIDHQSICVLLLINAVLKVCWSLSQLSLGKREVYCRANTWPTFKLPINLTHACLWTMGRRWWVHASSTENDGSQLEDSNQNLLALRQQC